MVVPLFGALPGGPELLVILLVLLLLFGPVVVAVVAALKYLGRDDEVEDLEARVEALERELARERERTGEGASGDGESAAEPAAGEPTADEGEDS